MSFMNNSETVAQFTTNLLNSLRPLGVILGPTASGKTRYSIELVDRHLREEAEIINADSRQLYRYMTIGTAKIRPAEMRGIPHHMLDVLDPDEEATAAWYKERVTRIIDDAHARGIIPILVGGSMLYISAVIDNLQFPSKSDPEMRATLSAAYDADGGESLYRALYEKDPETAASIDRRNKPYVIRAVELCEAFGKASEARRAEPTPYSVFIIGMRIERSVLKRRIAKRTSDMFNDGWIDEVADLLKRGYGTADPGMKSQGYREIAEAIKDGSVLANPASKRSELERDIATKTSQYAKRQMTWWRGDARIQWVAAD